MEDKLIDASAEPNVKELIEDFKTCAPWGDGGWNRVSDNENIRFTRWSGQHPDGKKHDSPSRPAFPFDGASDTRIPLADSIINENVAVCAAAFWRAMIRPKAGMTEASDYAVKLADYFINKVMYHDLVREVELSEQYRSTLGWVVLHPTWAREVCMTHRKVTMKELVSVAQDQQQKNPNSPLALLPEMIMNPELDEQTAQILQGVYTVYAKQTVEEVIDVELPDLRPAKLKAAIRELREKGETELPIPGVSKNQPEIVTLKPWDEIFISNSCTDIQKGPRTYRRVWMTEVELRSRILTLGWKKEWVEEALKHKGAYSTWTGNTPAATAPPLTLSDAMAGITPSWVQTVQANEHYVEVIYATSRQLDQDNVPGVYYTVLHVAVENLYADHGLLKGTNGQMPYVSGQRENWNRQITSSRGVPQVAGAWQREIKVQRDGLVDHTSLGVTPPVLVPKGAMGTKLKFAPAVQNEVTPGREPKFMDVPHGGTPVAMELMQVVTADVDNYFGRMAPEVIPQRVQVKQGMLVQPFLLMWGKALQMVLDLAQQYMDDAEFSRVTGAPPEWLNQHRNSYGALDVQLHFDVRELDQDYVMKQLETINATVLPGDAAGVVDRAKYTKLQLRAINPVLAAELVADSQAASQSIFKEVQNDIALMYLGNEPQYVEMDPTAQTKLQFASQIVQANPIYQQALQTPGRFQELMKNWMMNLQFSITQEKNKQVGAIGVNPMGGGGPGQASNFNNQASTPGTMPMPGGIANGSSPGQMQMPMQGGRR